MLKYTAQRAVALLGVVFVITVACFLLVHLLPGNPTAAILGDANNAHNRAILDRQLGLDRSLVLQYWTWLVNLLHGNLGSSEVGSINAALLSAFRWDIELVIYSQVLAYVAAIPLSVRAARRPNGTVDQTSTSAAFLLYCLPAFILIIWAVTWLTPRPFPGPGFFPLHPGLPWWDTIGRYLYGMFLPAGIIAAGSLALYFRLLRNDMVFTLQEDFITVARSKGLSDRRILWRHALRPSVATLLASTGNSIALLITGLFIVEVKFAIPGIGVALQQAILQDDYLLVQAIVLVTAIAVVVVNFVIDVLTYSLDPRISRV